MARSSVDLPVPLRPIKPYRLPNASIKLPSWMRFLPPLLTSNLSKHKSRGPIPPAPPVSGSRRITGAAPRTASWARALCASKAARAAASSLAFSFSMRCLSFSLTWGREAAASFSAAACLAEADWFSSYNRALLSALASCTGPLSRARMVGCWEVALPDSFWANVLQAPLASASSLQQPPSTRNGPIASNTWSPSPSPNSKSSSSKMLHT
mmetsp:Transcript_19171/g.53676  ORF Transcript_19171/g.53676 Transcript_19171/m.53676 type:complete len:210 (+) Transcript_19171:1974-2603(+)